MAASALPPNIVTGWMESEPTSSNERPGISGLELGFATGTSLVPFSLTGSSLAAASDHSKGEVNMADRIPSSGDSVQSHRSSNASPLPGGNKSVSRPPGLVPSPIGKPGQSYGSVASTAQNLTLTPTSSLDGVSDVYSLGRQTSPFHGDGPSIGSAADIPPHLTSFGSFERSDSEHDGLLGLQALHRDRADTAPGPLSTPFSSSPPVRGQIGSYDEMRGGGDPRRPRAVSRDGGRAQSVGARPPLAGVSGASPHSLDHKQLFQGASYPSGSRSRDPSPPHFPPDGAPRSGYSSGGEGSMYDQSQRRRASATDVANFQHSPSYNSHTIDSHSIDQLTQQFGQLPSLHADPSQHPGQHPYQRHQRSISQPGPLRQYQGEPYQESQHRPRRGSDYGRGGPRAYQGGEHDGRYNAQQQHGHPGNSNRPPHGTGYLDVAPGQQQQQTHRRSSLQSLPSANQGNYYGQNHPNLHRRDSLDFVPGHRYSEGTPIVASNEEMRIFTGEGSGVNYGRQMPGAQSPGYGGQQQQHNRYPSDIGSSLASTSPMSMGSGIMRGPHGADVYGGQTRGGQSDDDLSHPLIGEHIDVPGDDPVYFNEGMVPGHGRGHGRSNSAGGSYGGVEHGHHRHSSPSGPPVPMPKNVFNVKFKRTQRSFVMGPRLNRELKVGTYVKVEADRGEDLGIVVGKVPSDKYATTPRSGFRPGANEAGHMPPSGAAPSGPTDPKRIVRLATHDEVALLVVKREEEDELLRVCRTKVRQRGLNMNVVDAEYQFDRHKLTFFFEAEGRVDFRELVRDLFSIYKTRIWMQQLDKNTAATCPTGAEQPEPVAIDYGTPIMAPASEYQDFAHQTANSVDENTN